VTSVSITAIVARELQLTYVWSPNQLKQFALIAKLRNFDAIQENLLPVWFSADEQPMYHVPNELSYLQEGLLIQMVSPYVPFVHIKNGTLGIKGHVCSFPQRVQDLYTTLPRLPNSATFVKMVRSFKGEEDEFGVKSFFVR
jgi:hypothetical protein